MLAGLLAWSCAGESATRPRVSDGAAYRIVKSVAAVALEGRLAGVPYRPYRSATRFNPLPEPLLRAASQLLNDRNDHRDGETTRGRAAFELLRNQPNSATALLLDALTRFPLDATLWNDLSVSYIARVPSEHENDLRFASWALDAAIRASELDPRQPEPQFNIAVCLKLLGLQSEARQAWRRAASFDPSEEWRVEEDRRASTLPEARPGVWEPEHGPDTLPGTAALSESATQMPQGVREWVEQQLLPDWGRATLRDDAKRARDLLALTRAVSTALASRTGDRLLVDVAAEIFRADPRTARELACGFVAYADGVEQYDRALREDAFRSFREAARCLTSARSAFLAKADLQIAVMRYQLRDVAAARNVLAHLGQRARNTGYPVLGALADWTLGLAYMQTGNIGRAVAAYRSAAAVFERAGEGQNFAGANSAAADTLRRIGEHSQGWLYLDRALGRLSDVSSPRRRYTILFNASLYAEDDGLVRAALYLETAALEAARDRGAANTIIEALARRARLYLDAGRRDDAIADLDEAARILPSVASRSARAYVAASLQRSRARAVMQSDAQEALRLTEASLRFFTRGETTDVAALLLEEGLICRRLGRRHQAERRFLAGLDNVERRSSLLSRDDYRVAYLDEAWPLYEALIDARVSDGDAAGAFAIAERARAGALQPASRVRQTIGYNDVQRGLSAGAIVVSYVALRDRLVIWVIDENIRRVIERPVPRQTLERQIAAFSQTIDAARPIAELTTAASALFDLLIPGELIPADGTGPLVIVPDGALSTLPFGALLDRRTGRFLVESRALLVTPSVSQGLGPRRWRATEATRLLLVGGRNVNPAAGLAVLPQASAELRDVAAMYQSPTSLLDEAATRANLIKELPRHNILHFAGHAVTNERFPWRSTLVLAGDEGAREGDAENRGLPLERLMALDLSRLDLVVLSACRTATGPVAHGEGVIDLIRPFLAARIPAVVGSLWDVDDASTRVLMTRFHARLQKGQAPIDAMRGAQQSLLSDADPNLRHPRNWAAFVVTGTLFAATPMSSTSRSARH